MEYKKRDIYVERKFKSRSCKNFVFEVTNILCMCLEYFCKLCYLTCNVQAPYTNVGSVRVYNIFHVISQTILFFEKVFNLYMCFELTNYFCLNNFIIIELRANRYKSVYWKSVILVRFWNFLTHFRKIFKLQTSLKSVNCATISSMWKDGGTNR